MTDESEVEFDDVQFRAARFGKLPPRTHPDEAVAMTETDPPRVVPEGLGSEDEWMLRAAAG